ncbi:hypothetical protein Hypma_011090 [Hypsizygus marmoreus]|uniref:F-box domain-containing protein n=1 Tax=Hypsizygus marmoreus TaxID=39966 RepID=A0A369JQY1_HYPMA|nr:hypothetical protein Hypma_011090 [Hypsizygus marmoreus]
MPRDAIDERASAADVKSAFEGNLISALLDTNHDVLAVQLCHDINVATSSGGRGLEINLLTPAKHSVIDDEIARVQAILDKLQEQRTCLVSRIARINSAIAPYKKLSPELLADIFLYCIDPPLYLPPGASGAESSKIALSLELVYSLWRQVAVGTRKLWDNISVHYPYNREKNWLLKSDRVTAFAHGILSRGTRRIRVFMFPIGLPIARNPVGELLFPFSQQLSHIRINCSFSVLRPFLESPPGSFDALQSFALDVHRLDSTAVHPPQQITVFGRNPNLSELDLQSDNVRGLSRLFRSTSGLLWSRLTRLSFRDTVTGVSFTTAHSILSLCTSLIHCSFDLLNESILSVTATTSQATGSIIHDCLETLVLVSGSGGGNVTQFLKKLTLPSLKIFDISSSDGNWLPVFAALVTRSGCSLSSLTLRYASLSEGELEPLLASVSPTLEYLSFHATQLPDSMLERIPQEFLPRLKSLMCT